MTVFIIPAKFSFVYRAYEWVKNTPNYEIGKFVLNHANCYKLLKEFHHQETTKNKSSQLANPKIFIHNQSGGMIGFKTDRVGKKSNYMYMVIQT